MSNKVILDHDIKAMGRTIHNMEKQEQIMTSTLQSFREGLAFVKEIASQIHTECRPYLPDYQKEVPKNEKTTN